MKKNTFECLYMFFLIKPARYIKEVKNYLHYFMNGILNSNYKIITFILFGITFIFHFFLINKYKKSFVEEIDLSQDNSSIVPIKLIIIYLCSLIVPILFYSQAHSISDSVTILLILSLLISLNVWLNLKKLMFIQHN